MYSISLLKAFRDQFNLTSASFYEFLNTAKPQHTKQ